MEIINRIQILRCTTINPVISTTALEMPPLQSLEGRLLKTMRDVV